MVAAVRCFATVAVILVLASPAPVRAQEPLACTQMGCMNGLMLSVPPGRMQMPGQYNFAFVLDGKQVACRGELPLKACGDGPSIRCDKPGVTIMESGCAMPPETHEYGDIQIDGAPARVMVRITHNDRPFVTRTLNPSYVQSQPNGPGCGPVCTSASVPLFQN